MLAAREELFREHGIDSVDELRSLRAQGRLPELGSTDVVLLVDGFGALRDDFDDLDDDVADLLKRGSGYGIHVVAGMLRWNDVRIATQSMFGTQLRAAAQRPVRLGDRPQAVRDARPRTPRAGCSPTASCSRRPPFRAPTRSPRPPISAPPWRTRPARPRHLAR